MGTGGGLRANIGRGVLGDGWCTGVDRGRGVLDEW